MDFTATNVGPNVQLEVDIYSAADTGHTNALMTLSATDTSLPLTSPGEVGVLMQAPGNMNADTVDTDNFTVVPEPVEVSSVLMFGLFFAVRRRPVKN
jgi:hypothetical protein